MANRIITIVGPHEGVGKTTLAVNLAARYAQTSKQPVIILDTDPLARGEIAQAAGTTSGGTINTLVDQLATKQLSIPLLRGRIPLNRINVGSLQLAAVAKGTEILTNDQWAYFLQTITQVYDVFIDLELFSPLKNVSFDAADGILWTLTPTATSLRTTLAHFEALQNQKYIFQKVFFVLSQIGLPGGMDLPTVQGAVSRFGKPIMASLPFEPELPRLANQGRPVVLDNPRYGYIQGMSPLLDKITQLKSQTSLFSGGAMGPTAVRGGTATPAGNRVVETMLDDKRKHWNAVKQALHRNLVEELNIRRIDLNTKGDPALERQLRTHVENTVNGLITKDKEMTLNREDRDRLVKELVDETLGLGPLEELLTDPNITEIMVNRFDQVYIERRGKITLSQARFIDNSHVVQVIRRIISPLGRRIDESVPMVDARLKDGSRVNAIISPLAVQGPTLTIRRFPEKAFGPDDLARMGAITPPMVEFLKTCVAMKKNIIISGGTGTGKTTILNMLSSFIGNDERIITVEDTAELRMQQEHVVRLEARSANIEGQGQVAIRDLVKNCLRMRPDRIVIGECRGGEALDMLQAMNTGHDGSLTTIHANSSRDAFTRLETLCLMAGMDLPVWALREQIRSAVHILVQLTRMQDGTRKVTCITEVIGRNEETILTQELFRYVQDSLDAENRVVGHHESTGMVPTFMAELKARGLLLDETMFQKVA
jgi:pilus assembly protein CpaF